MLMVGQAAPLFEVVSSNGTKLRLSDFRGKKNVVLFFYPKDFTRVCTAEVCGFRDMYEDLRSQETEIVGVSLDSETSHEKFARQYGVPYPLVADKDRSLAKAYDAIGGLGGLLGITKRVTYVIDKGGKIRGAFDGTFDAEPHLGGVKRIIASLAPA